jgi:hypothetical protein
VLVREESLTLSSGLANMMLLCRQQICTGRSPMYVCMYVYVCMYSISFSLFLVSILQPLMVLNIQWQDCFFLSLIQNCRYYRVARGPVVVKTG